MASRERKLSQLTQQHRSFDSAVPWPWLATACLLVLSSLILAWAVVHPGAGFAAPPRSAAIVMRATILQAQPSAAAGPQGHEPSQQATKHSEAQTKPPAPEASAAQLAAPARAASLRPEPAPAPSPAVAAPNGSDGSVRCLRSFICDAAPCEAGPDGLGCVSSAEERQQHVRDAIRWAYAAYERCAFGQDELHPLSCNGSTWLGGSAATLVDSLDTLLLANFTEVRPVALSRPLRSAPTHAPSRAFAAHDERMGHRRGVQAMMEGVCWTLQA